MKLDDEMYRIGCACGDSGCDLYFYINNDVDDKIQIPTMGIAGKLKIFDTEDSWFAKFNWKLRNILAIIFNDYMDVEGDIVIKDKEHVQSIIDALTDLKSRMK